MISANFGDEKLHVGDTIRVHSKVVEGEKTRIQVFEGVLIRLRGRAENITFTVRRVGSGAIGVERTWPLNSNSLVKIEVKKKAVGIRRSKLYYLRDIRA